MKVIPKQNKALQETVANRLNGVQWHGHYFTSVCPFHHSIPVRASMFVYPDGYRCASCSAYGTLDYLNKSLNGLRVSHITTEEVVDEKPEWSKYLKEHGSYRAAATHAYRIIQEFPVLGNYFADRGLGNIIKAGKVGYIDGWYSFPIFDEDNNFVDWVLRASQHKTTTTKYAVRPRLNKRDVFSLYAADWDLVNSSNELYVPFGMLDMWTLHLCGFPAATGLLGKSHKSEWFDGIRKPIYLIPDLGEESEAYKFAKQLGWRGRVLRLAYPKYCKDPNDILKMYGKDEVILKIQESKE